MPDESAPFIYGNLAVAAPRVDHVAFIESDAGISDDGKFRYWLKRRWSKDGKLLGFVMLNPSTADAQKNDPTIRKCIGYAETGGYAGIYVTNLFALRATQPEALLTAKDPQGPLNDMAIAGMNFLCEDVICAWGSPTGKLKRLVEIRALPVRTLLKGTNTFALKFTQDGSPAHPLYLRKDASFKPYNLWS